MTTRSRDQVVQAWKARRPLIHHLTDDSCWLLSIPRPRSEDVLGGKYWYHLQIDTWLDGPADLLGGWLLRQTHDVELVYKTYKDIESLCRDINAITITAEEKGAQGVDSDDDEPALDAIFISHSNADHLSHAYLLQCPPSIPVFATSIALTDMAGLKKHFETIIPIADFQPLDWRATHVAPLPEWLSVGWITANDVNHTGSGLVIVFERDKEEKQPEMVFYPIHGLPIRFLADLVSDTNIKPLVLLHSILRARFIWQYDNSPDVTTQGAPGAIQAIRLMKPKYWVSSHDGLTTYSGLLSYLLHFIPYTIDRALKEEAEDASAKSGTEVAVRDLEGTQFMDVRMGRGFALL